MKKVDFEKRVNSIVKFVKGCQVDDLSQQLKPFARDYGLQGVFIYGAWCERNFECNLRDDYNRKTTFTSDFSIAEWFTPVEGMKAIADTLRNALVNWRDSIEFFAEIIIVLNMKSWEHASRGNNKYGKMYADLYYMTRDLFFDWFDKDHAKHSEAIQYYYDYVD